MRVEAGRVERLVVTPAAEVDEVLARVAEPDEAAIRRDAILDETLVVSAGLVPAQPDGLVAQREREVRRPEVGRLADVPVGVDDQLASHAATSILPGPSAS